MVRRKAPHLKHPLLHPLRVEQRPRGAKLGLPLLHGAFQFMVFAAILQSSVSGVHAINERIAGHLAERFGRRFMPAQRFAWTAVLLATAVFAAQHFGLVELVAKGFRALAVLLIAIFVLPLLTVGVWQLARQRPAIAVTA